MRIGRRLLSNSAAISNLIGSGYIGLSNLIRNISFRKIHDLLQKPLYVVPDAVKILRKTRPSRRRTIITGVLFLLVCSASVLVFELGSKTESTQKQPPWEQSCQDRVQDNYMGANATIIANLKSYCSHLPDDAH